MKNSAKALEVENEEPTSIANDTVVTPNKVKRSVTPLKSPVYSKLNHDF
jgi:hypothetical protein